MTVQNKSADFFTRVFGFSCSQGFLFSLLFVQQSSLLQVGEFTLYSANVCCSLIFMVLAFVLVRVLPPKTVRALLSPNLMFGYALLVVAATALPLATNDVVVFGTVAEGLLVGVPSGFMFCAWGRVFGKMPRETSSYLVIVGSLCGALACLAAFACGVCTGVPVPVVLNLLPLGSASSLRTCLKQLPGTEQFTLDPETALASAKVNDLSARVLTGAGTFGLGAGFTKSLSGLQGSGDASLLCSFVFFALLALVASQLYTLPAHSAQTEAEKESASKTGSLQFAHPQGALAYVYRLAILMMVAGYLFAPVLRGFAVDGQSLVFAGYIGLTMALIMIFLARSASTGSSAVLSFALGFGALFAGEALGIVFGNVFLLFQPLVEAAQLSLAVAGTLVLIAFLFLFTENDLQALSETAQAVDFFDEACEDMVGRFGLSKREAEILPLALKGRTGERIAEQFVISKSTVDTHLRRIYTKCGVHSRQELIDLEEEIAEQLSRG